MKKRHIKEQRNIAVKALEFYAEGNTDGGHKAAKAVRRVKEVKQGKPMNADTASKGDTIAGRKKARRSTPAGLA
jgi:hypothetical protein